MHDGAGRHNRNNQNNGDTMTTHTPIDQSPTTAQTPYQPRRQWQSHMLPVRNMHYHLRSWEPAQINPDLPVLVLAHG